MVTTTSLGKKKPRARSLLETAGKVVASDRADADFFGYSVSGLDSTSFVVGAPNNDDQGSDSGSVYAFTKSSGDWAQAAKFVASESVSGDRFGNAVSGLSSSSFIVGASEADGQYSDSGSVFIFTRSLGNWAQASKVVASDGAWQDWFGRSVSGLSSTAFVVGAHGDDDQDSKSGSAYIFTMSSGSWTQANKVVASDGAANDYFGVAVSGWSSSSFMVGAHGDDDQGSSSGSVYAFTRASGNWAQASKMVASDGASLDYFGVAVSGLSSTSVVVGAYSQYWNNPDLSGPGSAYIFTRSSGNWAQADKLVATDRASNDNFGRSVAGLTSTSFVTGADGDDDQGSSSGSVYAFSMSAGNWAQAGKVVASDAAADDHFGYSVSGLGSCYCVVGAKDDDNYQGSVYIIATGGSCNETTLESIAETTSESIAETTSESIAETTSESIAETTSESIAGTTSESIAETTSESVAEIISESIAEETTSESIVETTSESIVETTSESIAVYYLVVGVVLGLTCCLGGCAVFFYWTHKKKRRCVEEGNARTANNTPSNQQHSLAGNQLPGLQQFSHNTEGLCFVDNNNLPVAVPVGLDFFNGEILPPPVVAVPGEAGRCVVHGLLGCPACIPAV